MAEIDENSRALLGTVRSLVLKFINLSTSMIALADLGAPFICTLFSNVKLKLLELLVELSRMEDRLNATRVGGGGDPGDGGGNPGGPGDGGGDTGDSSRRSGVSRGYRDGGRDSGSHNEIGARPNSVGHEIVQIVVNGHNDVEDGATVKDSTIAMDFTLTQLMEKARVVEDGLTSPA